MTNIIHLGKDHRPGAKSDTAIETSSATKTEPGLGVSPGAAEAALEARINARRAELIARLLELRASMHLDAIEAGDKVKARLSELAHIIRENVVDGWTNLGDSVKQRLDRWLADTARQLAAPLAVLVAPPVTVAANVPAAVPASAVAPVPAKIEQSS